MDDETTGRLLRIGGMRAEVPPDREARVKRAFLDECRTAARARGAQKRTARRATVAVALALAAGAIIALRVWIPRDVPATVQPMVATVERVEGSGGRTRLASASTAGVPIQPADTLRAGAEIETGPAGRVSLRLLDGGSLRVDSGSRARLVSARAVELGAGAVYVDSGPESTTTNGLELHTSFGVVRDVGTQFEVRVSDSALRVRVRSGLVEVRHGPRDEASPAGPGTELTVGHTGTSRRTIASYGPEWAWSASLAPPLLMDGRPLDVFLGHLCREQGWTLAYADPQLARDASGMILHGSSAGLQPSEALEVALATTGLTHHLEGGELMVARGRQ